jgi:radical SAM superfamily enzyme YgiQ (UPF0313 family)
MLGKKGIIKNWRNIDISFGLVYPNIHRIGMSSYSIRLLYTLFNQYENVACERFFLPEGVKFPASSDFQTREELRSIENKLPLKNFDMLGFSIQFENDFKNILWILEKGGIPFLSKERRRLTKERGIRFPLLIAGGPVPTSNPKPISKIFDVFVIGDLEPILKTLLETFIKYSRGELSYEKLIQEMKYISGIYLPSLENEVTRSILQDLDNSPNPRIQFTQSGKDTQDILVNSFFIEINRGCPYQCKFCITSFHNKPSRFKSFETIKDDIIKGMEYSNFDSISLIGPCASGHPQFLKICQFIIDKNKRLLIPSIRIDHLTSDILEVLEKGNIKTITMAPETGSEELRYQIGKRISNENILNLLREIKDSTISNVKLYFLIGLPNEKMSHIRETIDMIKEMDKIGFNKDAIRISVNPLVPKLGTPYEKEIKFYLTDNLNKIKRKYKEIEENLGNLYSIKFKFKNIKKIIKSARLQTILSLGDRRINELLIEYYKNGANFGAFRRAQSILNFSIDDYLLKIKDCYTPWVLK